MAVAPQKVSRTVAIPELSYDVQVLAERLKKMEEGESLLYEEITKLLKYDVRTKYWVVLSARRHVLRDRIVIECVKGVGLKRLENDAIPRTGRSVMKSIRRKATRGRRVILASDFSRLRNADKIEHNASASILGGIASMTREPAVKKIQARTAERLEALTARRTMQALIAK